mgnify:CR=1 FL=1
MPKDDLWDLIAKSPNCKITINSGPSKPRKVAREGDVKFVRGRRMVRRCRMSDGCYVVRRGHQQYEWRWEPEMPKELSIWVRRTTEVLVLHAEGSTVEYVWNTTARRKKGIEDVRDMMGVKEFLDTYKPMKA